MSAFEELGICPEIIQAVEEDDWLLPTPVQQEARPGDRRRPEETGGDRRRPEETGFRKSHEECDRGTRWNQHMEYNNSMYIYIYSIYIYIYIYITYLWILYDWTHKPHLA